MQKYNIPTAEYKETNNKTDALAYVNHCDLPIVVKKDGLAAGKGVIIAETREDAIKAVETLYPEEHGEVVFEQFLEGEEFSLMTFINGDYAVPFDCIAQTINVLLIMMKDQTLEEWVHIVRCHI